MGAKALRSSAAMVETSRQLFVILGEEPALADLIGGVKTMLDAYEEGKIDRLFLVSNEFVNTMTQNPTVEQLLAAGGGRVR